MKLNLQDAYALLSKNPPQVGIQARLIEWNLRDGVSVHAVAVLHEDIRLWEPNPWTPWELRAANDPSFFPNVPSTNTPAPPDTYR